ncbi:MAG: carbohydrate porin [Acidobacteria bacterium]|nr:carbohydrate porin [Acidobacteriota bacterium]
MRRDFCEKRLSSGRRAVAIGALTLLVGLPGRVVSAEGADGDLRQEIELLKERVRELEEALHRNGQVEAAATEVAPSEQASVLDEVPLQERVDAIADEVDRLGYAQREGASVLDGLDGISVSGAVTTFVQGVGGGRSDAFGEGKGTDASFSGDLAVEVPLGTYGGAYARALVGQGRGVAGALPPVFSGPNADLERHDDGASIVELWYQTELPFPTVIDKRVAITVGKMDPRRFFDANDVANNQRQQFMADTFVNNLAVDWGGDENGYGLGARLGYRFTSIYNQNLKVEAQVGVFEVGGDPLQSFGGPFVIGEIDVSRRAYGLQRKYRLYAWTNLADHLDYENISTNRQKENWGVGMSLDHQLSGDLTLFGRYGFQDPAVNRFDHVVTLGARIVGNRWSRGGDILGLATGFARASRSYGKVSYDLDGVEVSGGETFFEAYYSYFLERHLRLSPDIQYIHRPGGIGEADDYFVFALRTQIDF